MKKLFRIALYVISVLIMISITAFIYFFAITADAKLDDDKLINLDKTVSYYGRDGELLSEETENKSVTDIKHIPDYVKNAFIAVEDKRFYSHNGIDFHGLSRAMINNLKSFSFKEGASTISQQLIKNTHLSGEKTLKRKLSEIKLSVDLERKYSKDEIMEMYLNTIFFGDNCFGITSAAKHYFSKEPEELTINEAATLAGLIKAPSIYSPTADLQKSNLRKNVVLKAMYEQKYITEAEYTVAKETGITAEYYNSTDFGYTYLAKKEFNLFAENAGFLSNKFKVYTYYDKKSQNILNENIGEYDSTDKSAVVMDNKSHIIAYCSSCGDIYRPLGSTIKPLLVYAPAIETNTVNSCTIISDEKTEFGGYSPSNYNDKYYGNVSVKISLSKSLNVCAVKLLNYTGIDRSLSYIKKTDIPITDNDNSLCLALGATEKGAKLTQITAAYSVFNNSGMYNSPVCIEKIEDEHGNILYKNKKNETKIFGDDTISVMNDMLKETVQCGTAKKLSFTDMNLYAKTGTVGNRKGNTDAYTISYSEDYIIGVWLGNADNALMDNSVTGGAAPSQISADIWRKIYDSEKNPNPIPLSKDVSEVYVDLISYRELKIEQAEDIAPKRYKEMFLFKNSNIPTKVSNRFSSPKIEKPKSIVNNNNIVIQLCLTELYNARVYKETDGEKNCVYDSINEDDKTTFIDTDISPDKNYTYTIVPYYTDGDKHYYGEEIVLPTIKTPRINLGDDWWLNEFD